MKHAGAYLETMRALAPLIRDVRRYSVWQFDLLCDWFAYHWNRGTISFVIDSGGAAHGVCVIKLFRCLEQFLEPFVHEPCGHFGMIEVFAADSPHVMAFLHDELTERWGPQDIMIWDRMERTENGPPRIYSWKDFERLARRITKQREEINYGR